MSQACKFQFRFIARMEIENWKLYIVYFDNLCLMDGICSCTFFSRYTGCPEKQKTSATADSLQ